MRLKLKAMREGALTYVTIMTAALLSICIIFGWIVTICLCAQVSAWFLALLALYPPAVFSLGRIVAFSKARWGAGGA